MTVSIGRDFDIFQKIAVKFPTPGQKCEVKYNWKSPPGKWFVVTGTNKNLNIPTPEDSKIIQMPYLRAKAIDQNPALCPTFPRRLDIDRCIIQLQTEYFGEASLCHSFYRESDAKKDNSDDLCVVEVLCVLICPKKCISLTCNSPKVSR